MTSPSPSPPWVALYPDGIPERLNPAFQNMLGMWQAAVRAHPARECLRYFDASLDFATVDNLSNGLAGWFREQGFTPEARVALLLQNTPHFVIALLAVWKAGAIAVPCNPMYRPGELAELFEDCAPSLVICHGELELAVSEALGMAQLTCAVVSARARDWQQTDDERVLPENYPRSPSDTPDFLTLCQSGRAPVATPAAGAKAIGLILYTSGTTGKPKGAAISHASMAFNSEACGRWMSVDGASRVLALAPLFHITGLILHMGVAMHARCPMALFYRFHPETALEMIRAFRPTFTIAAITAFNALMASGHAEAADFESLQTVYSGGAPVAPALRDQIKSKLGISLLPAYGMTESCSPTHLGPAGRPIPIDPTTGALAVGIPICSTEAGIFSPDGSALPTGEAGEVWMRGPQIMSAYWNKPEETRTTLTNGWLRSGDIGVMDTDGWLYLIDRQKDMINVSGFKVWPRQVEDALLAHPAIREAAVVGEPDAYRGETVHAYVSLVAGEAIPGSAELTEHCRARLATYKVPKRIIILEELPKTITGKIQRAQLRGRQGV